MKLSEARSTQFRKNNLLEELLSELNSDLQLSEDRLVNVSREMAFPLILVMGPLRSGTTLFTQWLANTGLVAYPTNLLSRFYQAPIIGSKIQLLLTDPRYNFRDELGEFSQQADYLSENGKTKGALAPNEFWYFWRRFLSEPQRDIWSDEELNQSMDIATMRAELIGMMEVFQKPFAAKGMLFNYNIPFLNSSFEKIIFIQIKRDPVSNVASVLDARKRQLGSEQQWYSFQIPEYEQLKELNPVMQASGQIHFINKALDAGISTLGESRKLIINYEDFCDSPELIFEQLVLKLGISDAKYTGQKKFKITRPSVKNAQEIKAALKSFQ